MFGTIKTGVERGHRHTKFEKAQIKCVYMAKQYNEMFNLLYPDNFN